MSLLRNPGLECDLELYNYIYTDHKNRVHKICCWSLLCIADSGL